ncbi:MAG: hypothetical protein U1E61_11365 [Bradyrhizobium sp.]
MGKATANMLTTKTRSENRESVRKTRHFGMILAILLLQFPDRPNPVGILSMSKPANAGENPPAPPERTMPPARNPEVAVEEEYNTAQRRGTAEALELFIARHPESPLAERARAELRQMKR